MGLDELELSVRAYNCLMRAGIRSTEDLCNKTAEDMMRVRNLGRRCLEEVIEKMKAHGMKFKDDFDIKITCAYYNNCPSASGWCNNKYPSASCLEFIMTDYENKSKEADYWKAEALKYCAKLGEIKLLVGIAYE